MKCPVCGYDDSPKAKIAAAVMNNYVNPDTKRVSCINSTEDTVTITTGEGDNKKTVTLVKQEIYAEQQRKAQASAQANQPTSQPPVKK